MCSHCCVFFETTLKNRFLSAAWELRRKPQMGLEEFQFKTDLSQPQAEYVRHAIVDDCLSHDEFVALLSKLTDEASADDK